MSDPVREPSRRPPAARAGATALLVASFLPVAGSAGVDSWQVGCVSLALLVAVVPLVANPTAATLLRLVPAVVAAVSLGWTAWLFSAGDAGWQGALRAATRVLVMVVPGVLLAGLVRPSQLGDQLGQWFHVPARPVVAAIAALERLDTVLDTVRELLAVRRVRGLAGGRSPAARARAAVGVTFALLVTAIRDAERMSVAMEARGFAAAARQRTWAEPARWWPADTVLVVAGTLSAAVPFLLSRLTSW